MTEERRTPKPNFPYQSPGELNSFLPYLLTRITHIWSSELNQALAGEKLPTPKLRLLSSLSAYGELTVGQLSTLGVMEQSTTSRTVDQLVDEGLAARSISDADQRKRTVVLTRKGRKKLAEISPLINDFHTELVGNVDPEKLKTCIEVLGEILKGKTDVA